MRLWIDDIRTPPDDTWLWAKTSQEAVQVLSRYGEPGPTPDFEAVSFDHDLGDTDTTRRVIMWMAEFDVWPATVYVHSMNPIGVEYLLGTANQFAPKETMIIRTYL